MLVYLPHTPSLPSVVCALHPLCRDGVVADGVIGSSLAFIIII